MKSKIIRYSLLALLLPVVLALPAAGWSWLMMQWDYSEGERTDYVNSLTRRGLVCKTWDGWVVRNNMAGTPVETFDFTVTDDAVAERIHAIGQKNKRMVLHYRQHKFFYFPCLFGNSENFVDSAREMPDPPAPPMPMLIQEAAEGTNAVRVAELIRRGEDPNARSPDDGRTPLMAAAMRGKPAPVRALLENGAEVNAQDKHGRTALMFAASRGKTDIVRMLLDKGADANKKKEDGSTALFDALESQHADVARLLIDHGADVNAQTVKGKTALMFAAELGNRESAALLLKHGASRSLKDSKGRTAEVIAKQHNQGDVAKLLESWSP